MTTTLEQAALGIIMLDTQFHRPVGDVGNPASWPFPVHYKIVSGASPRKVIEHSDTLLVEAFIVAGHSLAAMGCSALITSCGLMAQHQHRLASALPVPVASSSLLQIPLLRHCLGQDRQIGVVTYDVDSLGPDHFLRTGGDPKTPVMGVPRDGAFHALIEGGAPYDGDALHTELANAVETLLARHPEIGALVFECTNMPPFSRDISHRFGLPVYDALSLGNWLMRSILPTRIAASE